MFSYEFYEIFKNTHFEERLRKTASICFTWKYYDNSGGEFGLDETSSECKVSIFFKRNNCIRSNAAI